MQPYLDRFGSERADDDYARGDAYREMFLETPALRTFLNRDPGYRYILGTMGAGKSILLLKLREHLEMQHRGSSLFAPRGGSRVYTPSAEFANSVSYTAFWKLERKGRPDLNAWTQLWEWALLLCVLAHWKKWSEDGPQLHLERLSALCEANGDDPFASIASFLNRDQQSRPSGTAQLPPTQDMRAFVESYANDFPPTYVFLDSQDDFFQDSPDFWTASALGCRNAIDQILRRSNHRLHLVMTVRPEMLWSTRTAADATRHVSDMFKIEWNDNHLAEIFSKRASLLRDEFLSLPELRTTNPIAAFFGLEFFAADDHYLQHPTIENHGVGDGVPIREPLMQYLLRHTLGRPREMILLGNHILEARVRANHKGLTQRAVREAVGQTAHEIALAYLGEIKQRWPWRSDTDGSADVSLKRFLRDYVGSNIIDAPVYGQIEQDYVESCDASIAPDSEFGPFSVLASAGLIGWPRNDQDNASKVSQHFPRPGAPDRRGTQIPKTVKKILVHPILYDPEFAITVQKGFVVGPGVTSEMDSARKMGLV